MKKLLLTLLIIALLALPAMAREYVKEVELEDTAGTAISAYSLTSGNAVTSSPVVVNTNAGFISLLLIENIAGGAGDVDVSAEYSLDGTNFYTVASSDMAGTVTDDGNIATTFGNKSRIIQISARMGNYIRIKFDPDANSKITAKLLFQDNR